MKNLFIFFLATSSFVSLAVGKRTLEMPSLSREKGSQILHFNSSNKKGPFLPHVKAFVDKNFRDAKRILSDAEILKFACDQVCIKDGLYLEMGVFSGRTINFIAALNPHRTIYGFDSFRGLPSEWKKGTKDYEDHTFQRGTFAFGDPEDYPETLHNVSLIVGWFNETLPSFCQKHKGKAIAFLHIDSDVYESARDTFKHLSPMIQPGTVIVFDEYYNYPAFEVHEHKAFIEFINQRKDLHFKYIAYNPQHEQVVVKILKASGR